MLNLVFGHTTKQIGPKACQFVYVQIGWNGWNVNYSTLPTFWHFNLMMTYLNIALSGMHYLYTVVISEETNNARL